MHFDLISRGANYLQS